MHQEIVNKKKKIAVIGLGYVGLPIALEFAKKFSVIGFDISTERVAMMKKGIDPSEELDRAVFEGCDIEFTADPEDLRAANFFVVAVPTPIDRHNQPDLKPLLAASKTVGKVLDKGDFVVYESTVYPGCTEEDCVPILEKESGLKFKKDFKVGFSPERINPGDKSHTLTSIVKVVSGCDEKSLAEIGKIYGEIITAGIHPASSIKVAEASKIIENTQRDINIAFMNELAVIFGKMGINTYEVLEAARTKWNFLHFFPGLVGGHCIGVDPYYLSYKAKELGHHPQMIDAGRQINDGMGAYVAGQIVKKIIAREKNIRDARILIMGVTFKENVSDIRNSKVVDIYRELVDFGALVELVDPLADSNEVKKEYGFDLTKNPQGKYDAIVLAVGHREYRELSEDYFTKLSTEKGFVADVKGFLKKRLAGEGSKLGYWSL